MSDASVVGCLGKLPFQLINELQHKSFCGVNAWADAVPFERISNPLMTIDSVGIDCENLASSIIGSVLHSMNDIYCSGGLPKAVSLSLHLPLNCDFDSLISINCALDGLMATLNCTIGKIHTVRGPGPYFATVAVVGDQISNVRDLSSGGSVVLLTDDVQSLQKDSPYAEIETWSRNRIRFLSEYSGPKKDVSGDGVAGGLIQLSLRHNCQIVIDSLEVLGGLSSPNSNCNLFEQNYLSYASLVEGLSDVLDDRLRALLFQPFFVGPLICLTTESLRATELKVIRVGEFLPGQAKVSIR